MHETITIVIPARNEEKYIKYCLDSVISNDYPKNLLEVFVEIGNFTTIARGTLDNTIIHSHVKIDNLVHIAHNCIIGENSMVVACAEVSGSAIVGKNCWLGVGCSTMQKIRIGENSIIGIGAVVLEDVAPGAVMAGNPAKVIRTKK